MRPNRIAMLLAVQGSKKLRPRRGGRRSSTFTNPFASPSRPSSPATSPTPGSPITPPPPDAAEAMATVNMAPLTQASPTSVLSPPTDNKPAGDELMLAEGESTEEFSTSDEEPDYPLPEDVDGSTDEENFKLAVRDSIRDEDERLANEAYVEENKKQNMMLDDWLEAVKDVEDEGEGSVKEKASPTAPDVEDEGEGSVKKEMASPTAPVAEDEGDDSVKMEKANPTAADVEDEGEGSVKTEKASPTAADGEDEGEGSVQNSKGKRVVIVISDDEE